MGSDLLNILGSVFFKFLVYFFSKFVKIIFYVSGHVSNGFFDAFRYIFETLEMLVFKEPSEILQRN